MREPTIILLNGHSVKLTHDDLLVYLQISSSLNFHQRSFFFQYMEINIENNDCPGAEIKRLQNAQTWVGHQYHTPFPQGSGTTEGEDVEKL